MHAYQVKQLLPPTMQQYLCKKKRHAHQYPVLKDRYAQHSNLFMP
jgi:hypothetical protein